MEPRLKIAIQKSGRLQEESLRLLRECGIRVDDGKDQLRAQARNFPLDLLYLRNSDIPQYIEDGVAHAGILGENTYLEKQKDIQSVISLGFAKCRLSVAVSKTTEYPGVQWLQGKRIATSYPNSLHAFLEKNHIEAEIHEISGSVEIAPNIGLADAICDLVSSGSTLFQNGLEEKEVVLRSEAHLYANKQLDPALGSILDKLIFRIQSVLEARQHRYLLMNAPVSSVERITQILPGMKSPTVMPLAVEGWCSIHTVIPEARFWDIIDELKASGAQGILITPIEKMIL
ncbi:MAG: ATP phosphoribosyltransferase [Saprospiraceae bacterium]|nr:ATP phosphoribosyltransferase [Saprospiraceae bacterium]MDZ4703544.1 ATP phosphoribosyltransferase [Saprospiraceae bacterium]